MYNFSKTLQPLSKTLQPLTTRPKPPPNKRLNKNWGCNLNHLYVSHVAFDLAISFFPYPIKQQKNFLRLATKLANHLDRTSQLLYTVHGPVILCVQPLSFARNWFRSYSSAYCDWSQSSSNPLRMDFKPLPPDFFFGSKFWSLLKPRGRTDAWHGREDQKQIICTCYSTWQKQNAPRVYFSWSRGRCEQIKQLVSVHGLQAGVLSIDDSIGNWHLEPLETHHLLLKGTTHDETVNIHHFPLTQTVCSVHRL